MGIDVDDIVKNLITLRKGRNVSQRKIAKAIGVSYTTIQRVEKGTDKLKKLDVVDMANWLEACGSTITQYFLDQASASEIRASARNREILQRLSVALASPRHRRTIEALLDSWESEVERSDKDQR